ncbi:MAG: hypothetical protein EZS26_000834 [Candidatus Ordinivivax streblomastigis]|uniref:Ricin B lectin domain-containing protein n=1 Tax=Candidatus Ordinivivax streblomastigis TaxID=2540710 RepID=A0A5M8P387_9BACT|nr:MAG: hypothetical protein EZS26_000834 [Candidatus Ordinivivax streblomastigis]
MKNLYLLLATMLLVFSLGESVNAQDLPCVVSPATGNADADANGDVWYLIQCNLRTGDYYQDKGENRPLEAHKVIQGDASQLWKVVSSGGENAYKLVSKTGRELNYTEEGFADIKEDRMYTTSSSTYTYSFTKRADNFWQIKNNEEESYINKHNGHAEFGLYDELGDDGSSVIFILPKDYVEQPTTPGIVSPAVGNPNADASGNVWYYIQCNLRSENYYQDMGENKVLEVHPLSENDPSQLWKIIATDTEDVFRLISKTGNEIAYSADGFGDVGADRFYLTSSPTNTYSFSLRNDNFWQIKCVEINSYINKHNNHLEFGKYSAIPDNGSSVIFILNTNNQNGLPIVSDNDPIVATQYYTLQGVRVPSPTVSGIYLVKNIHASQKVTTSKYFIPQR